MREILFRGKRTDNGEWINGDLRQYSKKHIGIYSFELQQIVRGIDPSTVGQYTGLKDKNGKRIFEGDIARGHNIVHPSRIVYEVAYDEGGFYLYDKKGTGWHPTHIDDIEVIGNIHDNPELMEVR